MVKPDKSEVCKYCGIRYNYHTQKFHRHCKEAYYRGRLINQFTNSEVEEIKRVVKKIKNLL
ncbi:MAG: hypothetical protein ACOCP4_04470 [Candidatus Woesearchaeota archaeon]